MIVTQEEFDRQVERVRAAVKDPAVGLYGPDTMTWKISRETIVFLGAGRAALLQLAHPFVANAIEQHSKTRTDPIGRFNRTFVNVYGMIFGDLESVIASARRVRGVHDRIHGPIDEDVGVHRRGDRYRAHDAGALLWVFATLAETSAMAYEIGIAPLSLAEKNAFYEELKLFARLFGIPDAILPADWPALQAYCERMFASDELTVGRPAREIGQFLLTGASAPVRPLMRIYASVTAGLLPERIRAQYGLSFGRADRAAYESSLGALRRTWARLPPRLRQVPDYVEAMRRIEGRPGRDRVGRAVEQLVLRGVRPRGRVGEI